MTDISIFLKIFEVLLRPTQSVKEKTFLAVKGPVLKNAAEPPPPDLDASWLGHGGNRRL